MKKFLAFLLAVLMPILFSGCNVEDLSSAIDNLFKQSQTEDNPDVVYEEYYLRSPKFDTCYNSLNSKQKVLYEELYDIAREMPKGYVKLCRKYDDVEYDLRTAYSALLNNYAEFFWMPNVYFIGTSVVGSKTYTAVAFEVIEEDGSSVEYLVNRSQRDKMRAELNKKVREILNNTTDNQSQYEKEKYFNDYICENTDYTTDTTFAYTAYGCLVQGLASCEGYSKAFKLLCNQADIECDLIEGVAKTEPHMWNRVNIDGKHSYVDVTWNDRQDSLRYMYFNITDAQLEYDHTLSPLLSSLSKKEVESEKTYNFTYKSCDYFGNTYYRTEGMNLGYFDCDSKAAEIVKKANETGETSVTLLLDNTDDIKALQSDDINFIKKVQSHIPSIDINKYIFYRDILVLFFN